MKVMKKKKGWIANKISKLSKKILIINFRVKKSQEYKKSNYNTEIHSQKQDSKNIQSKSENVQSIRQRRLEGRCSLIKIKAKRTCQPFMEIKSLENTLYNHCFKKCLKLDDQLFTDEEKECLTNCNTKILQLFQISKENFANVEQNIHVLQKGVQGKDM